MDLRQLRYFSKVVESGSFSKAAKQLNVAQPALSQHVRRMEEELGVSLLHRSVHGVAATEAGQRLHESAKRILTDFSEIPDRVRGAAVAPRGKVLFGMPGTVSELLAAPLIEEARAHYPDIRIRVVEAMSGYVLEWLRKGDVDLAISYGTSDPRGFAFHHALSEEICLFASSGMEGCAELSHGSVSLADAARLPLIVPGPGHGLRELIESVAFSVNASISPAVEIDSYGQIKQLVSRGLGYGILPRMAVQREADAGAFRIWRFARPEITRKVYLAYSTERPLHIAPRAVGQLSWNILRKLVSSGHWAAELSEEAESPSLYI